jgi:sporulation protein YlmC with PRC-barrel domain
VSHRVLPDKTTIRQPDFVFQSKWVFRVDLFQEGPNGEVRTSQTSNSIKKKGIVDNTTKSKRTGQTHRLASQALLPMKTLLIRGAVTLFVSFAVASMSAQTESTASSSTSYIETSKFIGKKVRSAQGDEIGMVKDIVLDRNTGCLAYTVLSTTGGGGTRVSGGGKMVAVPWAVYSPSSDLNVLTVNVDRERIYNAPVFDYARIDEYSRPEYITNIYSYYGVSPGAAVGVGVSGTTTSGATTTMGATTTTGASTTTGAAAQAGATASPGGATSPAATGSPAEAASPGGRASATPHTTPAASPRPTRPGRAHATASPSSRAAQTSPPAREGTSAKATPEEPRGRRGMMGSLPESRHSPSEAASPSEEEKTAAPQQRERRGKREGGTPSERPPGEE